MQGGNVGVGTVTPAAKFQVTNGGQNIQLGRGTNTSGYTFSIGANDDGVNIGSNPQPGDLTSKMQMAR